MAWVISNTSDKKPQLYCFNASSTNNDWKLTSINSVKYDFDGSILLSPVTLTELSNHGVAVFETKISAKKAFKLLGVATCRYVELRLTITKEFITRPFIAESNWTDLNKHI